MRTGCYFLQTRKTLKVYEEVFPGIHWILDLFFLNEYFSDLHFIGLSVVCLKVDQDFNNTSMWNSFHGMLVT